MTPTTGRPLVSATLRMRNPSSAASDAAFAQRVRRALAWRWGTQVLAQIITWTSTILVVRLLAPALDYEDHSKDLDFSATGIRRRREAGYRDTMETLDKRPWQAPFDPVEGFILHEAKGGEMVETEASQ